MLEYRVNARRIDGHGSLAQAKEAAIPLDTDVKGRLDAFNPAELLLAAVAACMIKGIDRVAPVNHFSYRGVEVSLRGLRQDSPPHNVRKNGTIFTPSLRPRNWMGRSEEKARATDPTTLRETT